MAAITTNKTQKTKTTKRSTRKSKLKEVTGYDLFYQLIYMSATAASGIDRRKIFQLASELPRETAAYFRRIHLISQRLGYDYSEACKLVGERVKSEVMKSLLLRLSDALSAGQPESSFFSEEANIQTEAYEKEYERDLEALKKWTDAYGALVMSSGMIIIINLISVLIYPLDSKTVGTLVMVGLFSAGGGAWLIFRTAPTERRALFRSSGPRLQQLTRQFSYGGGAAVILICLPAALLDFGVGPSLILGGVFLLPAGILSLLAGKDVERKDKEIGIFLRSLGGYAASTGTTVGEALERLDFSSFPRIRSDLERLRARMRASISPKLCWQKFSEETGSRLMTETTVLFNDAIGLGGAADTVGLYAAKYAALTNTLRSRRLVVSATFTSLTIIMHGVLASLMVIIMEVIRNFSEIIEESMAASTEALDSSAAALPAFAVPELGVLQAATIGMIIALIFINAFAIVSADGDHIIKATLYLSALFFVSGLCFVLVPPMVANMVLL